jgi:hypothetical protein
VTRYSFKKYRLKKHWFVVRRGDTIIRIGSGEQCCRLLRFDVQRELERHGENHRDHAKPSQSVV